MPADPPDPCPKNKRFFFEFATDVINGLAKQLNTNPDFLLALSSFESGWLTQDNFHNYLLKNLFGVTEGGGNNLQYASFQEAADDWAEKFGDKVRGAQTFDDFLNGLKAAGYNVVNPQYYSKLNAQLRTIDFSKKKQKCLDENGNPNGADYASYHYSVPKQP